MSAPIFQYVNERFYRPSSNTTRKTFRPIVKAVIDEFHRNIGTKTLGNSVMDKLYLNSPYKRDLPKASMINRLLDTIPQGLNSNITNMVRHNMVLDKHLALCEIADNRYSFYRTIDYPGKAILAPFYNLWHHNVSHTTYQKMVNTFDFADPNPSVIRSKVTKVIKHRPIFNRYKDHFAFNDIDTVYKIKRMIKAVYPRVDQTWNLKELTLLKMYSQYGEYISLSTYIPGGHIQFIHVLWALKYIYWYTMNCESVCDVISLFAGRELQIESAVNRAFSFVAHFIHCYFTMADRIQYLDIYDCFRENQKYIRSYNFTIYDDDEQTRIIGRSNYHFKRVDFDSDTPVYLQTKTDVDWDTDAFVSQILTKFRPLQSPFMLPEETHTHDEKIKEETKATELYVQIHRELTKMSVAQEQLKQSYDSTLKLTKRLRGEPQALVRSNARKDTLIDGFKSSFKVIYDLVKSTITLPQKLYDMANKVIGASDAIKQFLDQFVMWFAFGLITIVITQSASQGVRNFFISLGGMISIKMLLDTLGFEIHGASDVVDFFGDIWKYITGQVPRPEAAAIPAVFVRFLFLALSGLVVAAMPQKKTVAEYFRLAKAIPDGLTGLTDFSQWLQSAWTYCSSKTLKFYYGEKWVEHIGVNEQIDEIYDFVNEHSSLEKQAMMIQDRDTMLRVAEEYRKWFTLMREYGNSRLLKERLMHISVPITRLYEKAVYKNPLAGVPRQEPIILFVRGGTGVGKSFITYPLAIRILKAIGKWDKNINPKTLIYARNSECEFFDGYNGQLVTVYDDFGQRVDSPSNPNPDWMEIIRASNNFPYMLHCASLLDKGTNYFKSEIVICSTNNLGGSSGPTSIVDPMAFERRLDLDITIKVLPELQVNPHSTLEIDHRLDMEKLRKRLRDNGKPETSFDPSIYEFHVKDQKQPLTFDELVKSVKGVYDVKTTCAQTHADAMMSAVNYEEQDESIMWALDEDEREAFQNTNSKKAKQEMFTRKSFENMWTGEKKPSYKLVEKEKDPIYTFEEEHRWPSSYLFGNQEDWSKQPFVQSTLKTYREKYYVVEKNTDDSWFAECLTGLSVCIGIGLSVYGLYRFFTSDALTATPESEGRARKQIIKKPVSIKQLTPAKQEYKEKVLKNKFKLGEKEAMLRMDGALVTNAEFIIEEAYSELTVHADERNQQIVFDFQGLVCNNVDDLESAFVELERECWNYKCGVTSANQDMKKETVTVNAAFILRCIFQDQFDYMDEDEQPTVDFSDLDAYCNPDNVLSFTKAISAKLTTKLATTEGKTSMRRKATPNSSVDPSANQLQDPIINNIFVLSFEYDQGQEHVTAIVGNFFVIKGRLAAIPHHYFTAMKRQVEAQTITNVRAYISRPGTESLYELTWEEITSYELHLRNGRESDLVFLQLPQRFPARRDLSRHIMLAKDFARLEGFPCQCISVRQISDKRWTPFVYHGQIDGNMSFFYEEDGVRTDLCDMVTNRVDTGLGDCGAVYLACSSSFQRKIYGVHTTGYGEMRLGACAPLVYEEIEKYLDREIEVLPPKNVIEALVDAPSNRIPVGTAEFYIRTSVKTKVAESLCHGEIQEPIMAPAILGKPGSSVFEKALSKMNKCVRVCPSDLLADAVDSYESKILSFQPRKEEKRVLTYEEAVSGLEGEDQFQSVKKTSSAGYPWMFDLEPNTRGKETFLGVGDVDLTSPKALKMREATKDLIEKARNNIQDPCIFVDTLKDEKRPIEKVEQEKTRAFSAAPLHFILAFRQYFLGFIAYMMRNRVLNESSVGIHNRDHEWDLLARKLLERNTNVISGDFSNFDGTLHPDILYAILGIVNRFYDDGAENSRIRAVLFEGVVHSYHVYGKIVYQWTHCQPSGQPMTSILNSMYNSILVRKCWSLKYGGCLTFNAEVFMNAYGDDNIIASSRPFYTSDIQRGSEMIGMEYGWATKDGRVCEEMELSQVTYLQHGFSFRQDVGRWVSFLSLERVLEQTNWVRTGFLSLREATEQNLATAHQELYFHDRQTYVEWSEKILRVARKYGLRIERIPYERAAQYIQDCKWEALGCLGTSFDF